MPKSTIRNPKSAIDNPKSAMGRWFALLICVFLPVAGVRAAPNYKVETIGACTDSGVSEAMRNALQPHGIRVAGDSGPFCEVWLRKVLPQTAGSTGASYSTLANGTFVGVIVYRAGATDYRGQAVKPGTYTLRYQTIPQDGNHLGVSPSPDFLLLAPAAADKNPDSLIEFQELIKLSKQASGTNHPNPLYLTAPPSGGAAAFREAEAGHWALEAKTKAQPAGGGSETDFPLALVLIGKAEG
jgi:hypothetical protein